MTAMKTPEHLNPASLAFVEGLYAQFLNDATSVEVEWRQYFESLEQGESAGMFREGPSFQPKSIFDAGRGEGGRGGAAAERAAGQPVRPVLADAGMVKINGKGGGKHKEVSVVSPALPAEAGAQAIITQHRVERLVRAYRYRGHMLADLDPLDLTVRETPPELNIEFHGLSDADLEHQCPAGTIGLNQTLTLRQVISQLQSTYCRYIGVEYMHLDDLAMRRWMFMRMEPTGNRLELSHKEQLRILTSLTDAAIFEEFIQKKFLGAKSFSLQGGEGLIPLMDLAIEKAGEEGLLEVVIGMAHRGRLNVLANIMGKSPAQIFREFADLDSEANVGRGDVKYHLGYSTDRFTRSGQKVHLSLCFNPSHLEFVNPIAMGKLRARQDRAGDSARKQGMLLLIHGDAAFIGEGVVQETLNLSQLAGYSVGGALHIIVNNQVGFTTTAEEGRSTRYASDIAKMLQAPIFHVNGEDPEAVAQVVRLAMDFRREFARDVVIDMYCFRRHGHNESDEAGFTQPMMTRVIEKRQSMRDSFLAHMLSLGTITKEEAERIAVNRRERLEQNLAEAKAIKPEETWKPGRKLWSGYCGGKAGSAGDVPTSVERGRIVSVLESLSAVPGGFTPHPKAERFLKQRMEMARGARALDYAAAEAAAMGTLALEGAPVRLTGQDVGRGTFSQRHARLTDYQTGMRYTGLTRLGAGQAKVEIHNSPLSEVGVMGFEYGYSLDMPEGLTMWEAQFGDFANVAQVIIDQFIVAAEERWGLLSGLVLLLPHGFEGQGPEHSSARLERFLELCAKDNIQVMNLTTPAQYFHALRRQVVRKWRKPLIIMMPKSLLRHPKAVSSLDDLATGRFFPVLADTQVSPRGVKRILLCTGKVYYDLVEAREEQERKDLAIVRVEELYPTPRAELESALGAYPPKTEAVWVQEEPENMGAWRFIRQEFGDALLGRYPLKVAARPAAASPATGSKGAHEIEQERLIKEAFAVE